MAKIEGRFATLNNTHTVKVCIYNKNLNKPNINIDASKSVKFSDNPVEITQQQDDTFEHILKTQCKIRLVTKEWLGDYLFAANYSSIVVNVWVDNDCVFCGYVVPRTYNQSYAHVWEEVEINCVDILSTLKDRSLTDNTTYEELVAQSTTRPFSWFLDQMDLDTTTVVIPNYPDIDYQEAEMMWTEIDWSRIVTQEGDITYYGVEAEVVLLDEDTAMNTGNTRQGQQKTPTWIESTDTCIVDGVSYYKEYAHITVNGEDVNTGDWRVGSNAGGMPEVVSTRNEVDGWTTGVLPQPFDFYEHYTTYNIYDNGMEIAGSDGIGDNIPEYPSTTTAGSYYEFRQGANDDVDVDEDTGYIYYKDYAWVCVNGTCENSGQWQRGNEKAHPTGTHTAITGWQYDNPPVPFEYYETISHYTDYSDGTSEFDHTTMGHQIPLTPNTTANGSYYEFRQGDADDLDVDSTTGYEYYKEYAWVVVNNVAEQTTNWRRGDRANQFNYAPIYGKMIDGATNPPTFKFGSYNGGSTTTKTADLFDSTTGEFGFTSENIPTYNRPWYKPLDLKTNIEELYYNLPSTSIIFNNWFTDCVNLKVLDIECFYVSNLNNAFKGCTSLTNLKINNSSGWLTMSESAFEGCTNLPGTIDLGYVNIDRCSNMFKNCTSLDTVKLSGFTIMYNGTYNYTSTGLFDGSSIREVYYYIDNWSYNNMQYIQLMYSSMMSASSKPTLIVPTYGGVEWKLTYDNNTSTYESNFDIITDNDSNNIVRCTLADDWSTIALTPVLQQQGYNFYKIPNINRQSILEIYITAQDAKIIMPIDKYIYNSVSDTETKLTFDNIIRSLDLSLWCNVPYDCDDLLYNLDTLETIYFGNTDYSQKQHSNMFYRCTNLQNVYTSNRNAADELISSTGDSYIPTTATVYVVPAVGTHGNYTYNTSTNEWEFNT